MAKRSWAEAYAEADKIIRTTKKIVNQRILSLDQTLEKTRKNIGSMILQTEGDPDTYPSMVIKAIEDAKRTESNALKDISLLSWVLGLLMAAKNDR